MRIPMGWTVENTGDEVQVTDSRGRSATGENLKVAVTNFRAKFYAPVIEKYKNIDLNTRLMFDEIIELYLAVTNCCENGIDAFCNEFPEEKERAMTIGLSINEVLDILDNEWGTLTFRNFFKR